MCVQTIVTPMVNPAGNYTSGFTHQRSKTAKAALFLSNMIFIFFQWLWKTAAFQCAAVVVAHFSLGVILTGYHNALLQVVSY